MGGIPHSQWGGTYDIVGGGGSTMFSQYRSRYNAMVGWNSPLEIEVFLDPAYQTATAEITVTGDITTADNKVIFILTNHQDNDYFCSVITYDEYDFEFTEIGQTGSFIHNLDTGSYNIEDITVNVLVQTLSGDNSILQAGRAIVSEENVPLHVENIDFGSVMVGESAAQVIEVFNYGDTELTGMLFPPAGFTCAESFSVPAHTIGEVEVVFAPQSEELYSDMLIVTTSHPDYPNFFVTLSGEGLPNNDTDPDQVSPVQNLSNYPNPFNPETTISYNLSAEATVEIAVYNVRGEKLEVLEKGYKSAGEYRYIWKADGYSAGVYLLRLEAGETVSEHKLVLLK